MTMARHFVLCERTIEFCSSVTHLGHTHSLVIWMTSFGVLVVYKEGEWHSDFCDPFVLSYVFQ